MRPGVIIMLSAAMLWAAGPATSRADPGHDLLDQGSQAFGLADFERALELFRAAQAQTRDPPLLAQAYFEEALAHEVLRHPELAVLAFTRALRCDPSTHPDPRRHKDAVLDLFSIAAALHSADADLAPMMTRLGVKPGRGEEVCLRPAARPPPSATAHVESRTTWPVYVLGGAALAAGGAAITLGVLASSKDSECQGALLPAAFAECDDAASTLELMTNISYGAAATFALATVGYWLFSLDDAPVTAVVGPQGASVMVRF